MIRWITLSATALGVCAAAVPQTGIERIDAHAHTYVDAPVFLRMLEAQNIRALNICVVDKYEKGFENAALQHGLAIKVFKASRGRVPWCSTFDPQDFESPGFAARTIAALERTYAEGAVAVKIYKSIGMNLKKRSGAYLMPDDPVLAPIFDSIARHNKTLYAHIAEPMGAWRALDPKDPDYSYYKSAPAWHMYGHPDRPTKEQILAARDRMVERNPKLRVIGCHLGSMEEDVAEIARRLDRYPNFAVDTAARVLHLAIQDREKVRAFLIRYQDRVLYATDLVAQTWANPDQTAKRWAAEYDRDWKYFATTEQVQFDGRTCTGLALPDTVLMKIFHDNAVRWVPGIQQ
jgi:predicted TIM-barrel fold metal-dependent hydrolase